MLLGATASPALEFRPHSSGNATVNAIEVVGRLEPGDAVALQAYIARLPEKDLTVVYLNSQGGAFEEAMALGRLFHRLKIRTAVVGKGVACSHACSIAFLGGRDARTGEPWRAKGSTALLGFRSIKIDWPDRDYSAQDMSSAIARTQRMALAMADYLTEVGASLEFLRLSLKAPATSASHMSNEDALALGLYVIDDKTGELTGPSAPKPRAQF
jgi:hypothetical protein